MNNIKISKKEIKSFQTKILDWYKENQRDLPWRKVPVGTSLDQKAYRILVSEIMSQQTQISRVIPKYETWMKVFPTVESLAKATTAEVLRLWSGLGYNRRSLYLQKCAKAVVHEYGGTFPQTVEELKKLPGIGEYTAAAVSCFAFDQQIAVIDTNVRKVILTQFKTYGIEDTPKSIEKIAVMLLPDGRAYEWNQALMDYAAVMLKKEKIPIPKQIPFKTSDRYFRGQILKQLIEKQRLSVKEIQAFFKHQGTALDDARLQKIILGLVKDMLISEANGVFMLASS